MNDRPAYPGIMVAIGMTVVAWATALAWQMALRLWVDHRVASVLGLALGPGLVGAIAFLRVRKPAWPRVAGGSLDPRFVIPAILLVPSIVPALALHAWCRALLGQAPVSGALEWWPEFLSAATASSVAGTLVIVVLLVPPIVEWFFRGVLFQGIAESGGAWRAVVVTSVLAAVYHAGVRTSVGAGVAVFVAALGWNLVLGMLRARSGSLLAPLLVHAGSNAIWFLAVALSATAPLTAITTPGSVPPPWLLWSSSVPVAVGIVVLARLARRP